MLTVSETMKLTTILISNGIPNSCEWINSHSEEECREFITRNREDILDMHHVRVKAVSEPISA